ncbi:MAG: hypothetical protein M1813_000375 [Trichoglossum hirsutum]|nr:MAG: hypothetical protein M1813_000375 [Trichoglossum hirsutum]
MPKVNDAAPPKENIPKESCDILSSQGSSSSTPIYLEVRREWVEGVQISRQAAGQPATELSRDTSASSAMRRWQQESMRDQPYNNIGAVALQERRSEHANDKSQSSGVRYLDRED